MQTALPLSPSLSLYSRLYFAIKQQKKIVKPLFVLMASLVEKRPLHIVLTDDSPEDCELFSTAMEAIAPHVRLTVCDDGDKLMTYLYKKQSALPDLLFLDLNMPLKNGYECLQEIRANETLKTIPIIIYSTSTNPDHIKDTFDNGANFYFPKPDSFRELKAMMEKIMSFDWQMFMKPDKSKFILSIKNM